MTITYIIFGIVIAFFLCSVIFGAPFVPSKTKELQEIFTSLYKISPKDIFVDLGCGSGTVLKAANRLGAQVIGYEINPALALISKLRCPSAKIYIANFLQAKLPSSATVFYIFGVEHIMPKIYQKIAKLAKDHQVYLISYGFALKNCQPVKHFGAFYLYKLSKH